MPRKKRSELTAGIFVLAAVGAVFGVVLWLGASEIFSKPAQQAVFYVDARSGSVGLLKGNIVEIGGVEVGRISRIEYSAKDHRGLYYVDILADDVQVHSDGSASVAVMLVGQGKLVITDPGSKDKPLATADNPVRISGGLDQAMGNLAVVTEQMRDIVSTVKSEMDASRKTAMLAKVHTIMDELKSAAGNISGVGAHALKETDAARSGSLLAKIHRSVDDMNSMTGDAKPKLERTLTAVDHTAANIDAYTSKDIQQMLATLREVNSKILKASTNFADISDQAKTLVVVSRDRVDNMLDNMVQVSDDLKATSKEVRRNPWRLLYKPEKPELKSQNIYDASRAFSTGASQLNMAVGKLQALAKANPGGISAEDPELARIRKQVMETFGNFSKAEQALWQELQK